MTVRTIHYSDGMLPSKARLFTTAWLHVMYVSIQADDKRRIARSLPCSLDLHLIKNSIYNMSHPGQGSELFPRVRSFSLSVLTCSLITGVWGGEDAEMSPK
jgi:hypothetical protein